jgi:hypothetical protein
MQEQLDWARGKPDEYVALDWQTQTAAFSGKWRHSQELSNGAVELATRSNAKEVAGQYAAESPLRGAAFGQCSLFKATNSQSAGFERNIRFLTREAVSVALCGDAGKAQSLVDELTEVGL